MHHLVLGAEVYAFADAFDYSYTLKHDLEQILEQFTPLRMFTDSTSLFGVISKSSATAKKRLLIDITSVHEANDAQ